MPVVGRGLRCCCRGGGCNCTASAIMPHRHKKSALGPGYCCCWCLCSSRVEMTTADERKSVKMLKSTKTSLGLPWFLYNATVWRAVQRLKRVRSTGYFMLTNSIVRATHARSGLTLLKFRQTAWCLEPAGSCFAPVLRYFRTFIWYQMNHSKKKESLKLVKQKKNLINLINCLSLIRGI